MASEYVTFDDLVRFHREVIAPDLDKRFALVAARFDQVEVRFEQVDARFDQVDARFERVDERFDRVDARFERVDARFEQQDARFGQVDGRLDRMTRMIVSFDVRMQEELIAQHDEHVTTRRDTLKHFDELYARLDRIAGDWEPWKRGLRNVEHEVERLKKKIR